MSIFLCKQKLLNKSSSHWIYPWIRSNTHLIWHLYWSFHPNGSLSALDGRPFGHPIHLSLICISQCQSSCCRRLCVIIYSCVCSQSEPAVCSASLPVWVTPTSPHCQQQQAGVYTWGHRTAQEPHGAGKRWSFFRSFFLSLLCVCQSLTQLLVSCVSS